ncbi:MAG: hypothetical protein JW969_18470 [Spirochaetales bacterium]|nr:hypothetical protein [Spirochaetales bacterium]
MFKMFLDSGKTLSTCGRNTCEECDVSGRLKCHFNGKQLAVFLGMVAPLFIIAGYSIFIFNPLFMILWIAFALSYFGFIEIRVMCSHCPHYAEPGMKTLKCWANYGSPKLWKYRPGPMSLMEKTVFITGLAVIFLPPVLILPMLGQYLILVVYTALLIAWKTGLRLLFCKRCINFACPFNAVDKAARNLFFENNPEIKQAWGR